MNKGKKTAKQLFPNVFLLWLISFIYFLVNGRHHLFFQKQKRRGRGGEKLLTSRWYKSDILVLVFSHKLTPNNEENKKCKLICHRFRRPNSKLQYSCPSVSTGVGLGVPVYQNPWMRKSFYIKWQSTMYTVGPSFPSTDMEGQLYIYKKKICVLSGLAQLKLMLFKGPLNMNVAGGWKDRKCFCSVA